jgi:GST-like protein
MPTPAPSADTWTLYGSDGSGSAAVELALGRAGLRYRVVRASTWEPDSAREELARVNPLGQIPTLLSPTGERLTESAAILFELGLRHPGSGLLPADVAGRAQAGRGLVFLASNCYAAIGVIDYPERWLAAGASAGSQERQLEALRAGARARLHALWVHFADQFQPATGAFLGGEAPGALDLLAVVVSRWSGARAHLRAERPDFHALLERIEQAVDPAVWQRHFPRPSP